MELLREAGVTFEQRSPPFSDPDQPPDHLQGHEAEAYAASLAQRKARSLAKVLTEPAMILSADTICVDASGRLVGKPRDQADAEQMLRLFVNSAHWVITGVALLDTGGHHAGPLQSFADTAIVTFGQVSDAQLADYLGSDEWRGKAGGYNLFDRQAAGWPIQVEGDPATVVGLPMRRLEQQLDAWH